MLSVNADDVSGLYRLAMIILIVSGSLNLLISIIIIVHQKINNPAFWSWFVENHRFAALITTYFKQNILLSEKKPLLGGGVLNLAFQDIPQLVILAIYWTKTNGYMIIPFISLIFSVVILFIDSIYEAIIIPDDDDATTHRLNGHSSESTYQYSMRIGAP
ncbi:hypothetical protein GLOIN_2v1704742 [Rhizophagus clarus]|uniref:Uncharacterized protein n=1 Tax=Rhizophagus clarus TaxID=94130 RepID=A0A8H3LW43_9GLOM|nr:hypothetical protein GLOIN_2v1704742 [Rhizophagus clarus]